MSYQSNYFTSIRYYLVIFCVIMLSNLCEAQSEITERYPNGVLKSKGLLDHGSKNGTWVYYYINGEKSAEEHYVTDKLDGSVTYYFPNKKIQGEEKWVLGKLEDSARYYHQNGFLEKKGT